LNQAALRIQIQQYYAGQLAGQEQQQLLHELGLLTTADLEALYPATEWDTTADTPSLGAAALDRALQRNRQLRQPARIIPLRYVKAACIIGLLAVGSYVLLRQRQLFTGSTPTAAVLKTIHIPDGKSAQITLPDGTHLTANGGSVLRVPERFTGNQREIFLEEGEVFADVATDASHPFVVHSRNIQVEVLGTSFSIRNYQEEAKGTVSVRTGKVAVSNTMQRPPVYLTPGFQVTFDKAGQLLNGAAAVDSTTAFGWMSGHYVFRSATLREIIAQLKHSYDVRFIVKRPALLDRKFKATFRKNSIAEIMEQLRLMSDIHYTLSNKTVIIQ
jgi:ferric-dicitrate binding protein FerR (iron transport regulator)